MRHEQLGVDTRRLHRQEDPGFSLIPFADA